MATPDRGGDLDAACRALEAALRARLCVTSVRIRLRMRDHDVEYESPGASAGLSDHGAQVTLMIRDSLGIVGDIDVTDGCHPTCTGRAIREMAGIVQEHAARLRRCRAPERVAAAV